MTFSSRLDLHIHTTVSDGTDSPEEILPVIRNRGLEIFSVTDHDAIKGCRRILAERKNDDPAFITGVEFSCRDEGGKYHILGYGYDLDSPGINRVVETGHGYRMKKITARIEFLKDRFGFHFTEEEIESLLAMDNPGKPHLANLMVSHGYCRNRHEAIQEFIDQQKFKILFFNPAEVIDGILASGGIPVLAHPTYGSGDQLILGEEMEQRIKHLIGFGLKGLEAFYSGFPKKMSSELLEYAERFDLYVTAGSDYHGSNKLIVPGDTGLENCAELPGRMRSFLEVVLR